MAQVWCSTGCLPCIAQAVASRPLVGAADGPGLGRHLSRGPQSRPHGSRAIGDREPRARGPRRRLRRGPLPGPHRQRPQANRLSPAAQQGQNRRGSRGSPARPRKPTSVVCRGSGGCPESAPRPSPAPDLVAGGGTRARRRVPRWPRGCPGASRAILTRRVLCAFSLPGSLARGDVAVFTEAYRGGRQRGCPPGLERTVSYGILTMACSGGRRCGPGGPGRVGADGYCGEREYPVRRAQPVAGRAAPRAAGPSSSRSPSRRPRSLAR